MSCRYSDDDIVLYYYDELDSAKKQEMEAHINGCARCSSFLKNIKTTMDSIRIDEAEMDTTLRNNFRVKVRERIEKKKSRNKLFYPLPRATQAAVLTLLIIISVFGGQKYYEVRQERKFIMENYELLENMEMYEELDILMNLEELETV